MLNSLPFPHRFNALLATSMCARVLIPDPVPPSKFRMSNLIVFLSVLIPVSEILYIEQPSAGDSVNILLENKPMS